MPGLPGAAGTPTGPWWCCLRGQRGCPRQGHLMSLGGVRVSLAHRDEDCFLGQATSCVWQNLSCQCQPTTQCLLAREESTFFSCLFSVGLLIHPPCQCCQAHLVLSEGLLLHLVEEWANLGSLVLLGWGSENARPGLPSSIGWGHVRHPAVVLFFQSWDPEPACLPFPLVASQVLFRVYSYT